MTAVAGFLSWQAYRAEKEAVAVAKLKALGVDVTYKTREPRWLGSLCGERMGRTVVMVGDVTYENVEAAIPYLRVLPNLKEVHCFLSSPDYWHNSQTGRQIKQRENDTRAILEREMPNTMTVVWTTVI
jgi:hypothetical protein